MSWHKTGWGDVNEEGAKSPFENKGPRRFWLPPEGKALLLFLDEDPTGVWQHQFKMNGKWDNFEICLKKSKIADRCPIDDSGDKMFPSFVGQFTVMNMTSWFTKKDKREVCFKREVFGAKIGSKDKPGILKKIERMRSQEGSLRGSVYEVYRSGSKTESCGDEFRLVEKIDIKEVETYARTKLGEFVKRVNAKLAAKDHVSIDKLMERDPWKPINFEKLYETDWKPRSLAELDRLFSRGGAAGSGGEDSKDFQDNDGGGGDSGGDDDVPY